MKFGKGCFGSDVWWCALCWHHCTVCTPYIYIIWLYLLHTSISIYSICIFSQPLFGHLPTGLCEKIRTRIKLPNACSPLFTTRLNNSTLPFTWSTSRTVVSGSWIDLLTRYAISGTNSAACHMLKALVHLRSHLLCRQKHYPLCVKISIEVQKVGPTEWRRTGVPYQLQSRTQMLILPGSPDIFQVWWSRLTLFYLICLAFAINVFLSSIFTDLCTSYK